MRSDLRFLSPVFVFKIKVPNKSLLRELTMFYFVVVVVVQYKILKKLMTLKSTRKVKTFGKSQLCLFLISAYEKEVM